ncbi:phosphoglycerate mutase [Luteimonas kalidii]|uniref:Phosphoglycerate mutase n=1 Tax=Luteimonas kalidii TaxID=3042025 RepID=A0ABT6JSR7_9GAMM|nr:phosphoglycerate mutase [Luteimonas kalidii]MDH5833739.1 phosphoglycerate mutase [Luteimonas kalidii]
MTAGVATLLLPAARRLGSAAPSAAVAIALGRADVRRGLGEGRRAQLLRHLHPVPQHWPVAALTRQRDAGDAAGAAWLRADPCRVQPDINGARLLGVGETLGLDARDAAQLLPALKPLFGDAGMPIDAPVPGRWYLRLPPSSTLPQFTEPDDALGADLFEHLAQGPEGRRWRGLLSEAQVVLHNHPWNAQRLESGRPAINSLWFWGGGVLPDHVRPDHAQVCSDDEVAGGLASLAGVARPLPACFETGEGGWLFDLVAMRDAHVLERDWLRPALDALRARDLHALHLDSADGTVVTLARGQRWRFWRRPAARLVAA